MAVIYGWTYAIFHANVGWNKGDETVYNYWENYWAMQIDSYIFSSAGTHITDADEKAEIALLVNKMMVLTNLFLKGEQNESPMGSGFYSNPGFPSFRGYSGDEIDRGSGDYVLLNKYKRKYGEEFARADSIRVGTNPDNIYFPVGRRLY